MVAGNSVGLFVSCSCFICCCLNTQVVHGQVLPPQVEPRVPQISRPEDQPQIQPQIVIPELQLPPTGSPAGAENVRFVLRALNFEGATAYSEEELARPFASLIGTEITLARLFEIAHDVEARYRSDGYVLSRAIVPPQEAAEGRFRIRMIEGFISDVAVEGEVGDVRRLIDGYLQNITGERPVDISTLERYLLLVNDLPGITARGVLRPGAGEQGAAQLVVEVERKPFEALVGIDNRSSRYTGPWTGLAQGRSNSWTRFGEQVQVTGLTTIPLQERQYGEVAVDGHFGTEGLSVRAFGSYSPSEPGFSLEPLDVESEALRFGASLHYPVIRSRQASLFVDTGFDVSNVKADSALGEIFEDDLRVGWLRANGNYRDSFSGITLATATVRQGLGMFGATDQNDINRSRADADGVFTKVTGEVQRLQTLLPRLNLLAAVMGQYAFDPLLADEEFALGGVRYGRGYDPSELAGDHGLGGSLELQYNPDTGLDWLTVFQIYAFYDIGAVWNKGEGDGRRSLASAGIGVRTTFNDWLSADVEAAKPLTRALSTSTQGDKPLRFFLNVVAEF
ncbi:hemolysin activation/secretion protein [Skermanella aerolata]|uniref:ShlB/FhaC/HecB family hemolysin secretion/activation protein n=1 Tax=Skermanella aerolata TaxID=393310 RepID=UPI003D1A103C